MQSCSIRENSQRIAIDNALRAGQWSLEQPANHFGVSKSAGTITLTSEVIAGNVVDPDAKHSNRCGGAL